MRGAAFVGGEGPGPAEGGAALGHVDVVVAADSGLQAAELWGIRVDWIVGDMDSLDDRGRLGKYPADRVLEHPQAKDATDTELALDLLRRLGCDDLTIVGGGGGRLDHALALAALFDRKDGPDRWITAREDVRLADADRNGLVAADLPPGSLVSVFPAGGGPWEAASEGLRWPLPGLPWERGFFGISNEATGGRVEVRALRGRFLVVLPLLPAS